MKGNYFQHLSIDIWPYSLTFDTHCCTDLFVLVYPSYQIALQLHNLFWSNAYKLILAKLQWPVPDLYMWPFTLVAKAIYLSTYI